MAQLWRIILWVLWRHRPFAAVEASLCDIIRHGLAFFADPEACQELEDSRYACAVFSAGLLGAHSKLDFLIHLRALEIAGLTWRGPDWTPCRSPHHSDRTPEACWRRFRQLILRFEQVERLAQLRAARMKQERAACPLVSLDCAKVVAGETPAAPWAFEGRTKHGARPRAFVS